MRNANLGKQCGRLARLLGSFWHDREGVTAILTALGATTLMGFAGLAIDATVWHVNQRKIQGAADQAAVAAGLAANVGASMVTQAKAVAASYGLVDGSGGVTVSVNNPPSQGAYKSDNSAIEVIISQVQPQYLSRFFLSTAPTVTERAVALYGNKGGTGSSAGGPPGKMCIMALDVGGKLSVDSLGLGGSAVINAPTCDVYNDSTNYDSTEVKGTSSLTARNIYMSGLYDVSGSASMSVVGTPATGSTPAYPGILMTRAAWVPDPYLPDPTNPSTPRPIPSYSSACTKTGYKLSPSTTDTLSAGTYCNGMDIKGNLTLGSGIYVIDGGDFTVDAGATITGTGVTIIMTSSTGSSYGTVTINGGATVSLSAPSGGSTAGIAFWIDGKAPTATAQFNGGSTQIINGAIYLPSQQAQFAGGSSSGTSCSQLIALTINFTGNAYFQHTCASTPVTDPPATPILAE